jgi:outer membrane lipoprotein-sorting protein
MNRKLCTLLLLALPSVAGAQTADEIVAKSLAARGGVEKIKAVQAQRISGTISFGQDAEGPFVIELKRPLKLHMEVTFAGQKLVRVYNGKGAGWTVNPFAEDHSAQPMAAEELKNIDDEADFDGPLVDYKSKGNQVALEGKDQVDGKEAFKIKMTKASGDARTYFIDAASYQVVKWQGKTRLEDRDVTVENYLRDYRDVQGLQFPFEIDSDSPDSPQQRKIIIEKIELDPKIEETHFGKPPAAPPSAAKK